MPNAVNSKNHPDSSHPQQEALPFDGNLDLVAAVKAAIAETTGQSKRSRAEIADRMNALIERRGGGRRQISEDVINKWAAPGSVTHFPSLPLLAIFCEATASNLALEAYSLGFKGVKLISDDDHNLLLWARSERELRLAKKRARRMAQEVGIE
jgi:hypothetical protein